MDRRAPFTDLARLLRENEIGRRACLPTPYGRRLICYADVTATGRFLELVESWIRRLRPYYANTHTAISSTGRLMTELREQSRAVIARAVDAGPDDVVLFVGSGATAAVNKLVGLLGLRGAPPDPARRPAVFVGPYEHHSNELPWIESTAEVVEICLAPDGTVDLADLRRKAEAYADRPWRLGTFSAASNVTGVLTDVPAVARTLHQAGAYAVFDYAAAAPYLPIDMHPPGGEHLDGVVLSTHKFAGGPQSSGVLVANRALFRTAVPERPGGGTVDYVAAFDRFSIDYTRRLEEREEGGTPAILGDIRAGAAFLVKEMVGADRIVPHETALSRQALARLRAHPRIRLLGPTDLPRLAILSFNIEGLHHDFVSGLLDHLFGVQNRAGCACAGPYGHRLLGIDQARSERYRREIARGNLGIKPGWVRVTLPFYASPEDVEFILAAIEFVADHGDLFLSSYVLDWRDGVWRHRDHPTPASALALTIEALTGPAPADEIDCSEADLPGERARYFTEARERVAELGRMPLPARNPPTGRPELDALVWFRYVHTAGPPP
jgi:selenocysteine lyase/cysteine desulfurase